MKPNKVQLSGWGRLRTGTSTAFRPERLAELTPIVAAPHPNGLIPRGLGRSYGDAAVNQGGDVVITSRLDHYVDFDPQTGLLIAEAGVTFRDLLRSFLPRGWLAPVSPGTAFVTLGGAVAMDVHGKNHDRARSFGQHVVWLDLLLPDGTQRRIDAKATPEIFAATIGGCGLTGIIQRVALTLMRVPSPVVRVREQRLRHLDDFMAALAAARDHATYSVGWIDAVAKGVDFGRGILETAEPEAQFTGTIDEPAGKQHTVPVNFPSFTLNKYSVAAFNAWYWRRVPPQGRERLRRYEKFLYPLDAIGHWNRIYGRRGFHQFQCVLPDEMAERGIPVLLQTIVREGAASFLSVLKTLGGPGLGYLSFAKRGFTLALDIPNSPHAVPLLRQLEAITLDHGGRIYLAKDSALTSDGFAQMYPRLEQLRHVLRMLDPNGKMLSDMARRLRIHP